MIFDVSIPYYSCSLNTGVPYGSILGPLLFIIYISDIREASEEFHAIFVADDTSLFSFLGSFSVALNDKNFNTRTFHDEY